MNNKKDIYVTISCEYSRELYEIPNFICNWEYEKEERLLYQSDEGKIETNYCNFRFIRHSNILQETVTK